MDSPSFLNSTAVRTRLAVQVLPRWIKSQTKNLDIENFQRRWAGFVNFVSNLVVLTGVVFSIYQFMAYQHDERVRYTFQFVEKFDDERFIAARRIVSESLRSYEQRIARLNEVRMNASAETKLRERLAQFLVNDSNNKKGIVQELSLLISFFNGLQICIEENICDKPVANAFFKSHAEPIWVNFRPYILGRRDAVQNYGLGLEYFLKAE